MTGRPVTACDADGVTLSGGLRVPSATFLCGRGVMASPAGRWLDARRDSACRVVVTSQLALPDDPQIFAIGDTAAVNGGRGGLVPGVAPAAKQM